MSTSESQKTGTSQSQPAEQPVEHTSPLTENLTSEAKEAMDEFASIKKALREAPPQYPLPKLNEKAAKTEPAIELKSL
jgi:hypothetical protein